MSESVLSVGASTPIELGYTTLLVHQYVHQPESSPQPPHFRVFLGFWVSLCGHDWFNDWPLNLHPFLLSLEVGAGWCSKFKPSNNMLVLWANMVSPSLETIQWSTMTHLVNTSLEWLKGAHYE